RVRNSRPGKDRGHAGIDASIEHELVRRRGLFEMGEMRALYAFLPHPDITRVEGEIVARGAGAEYHHAAALHDQAGDREGRLAGMLEHDVDIALPRDVPNRLAEPTPLLHPAVLFRRAAFR